MGDLGGREGETRKPAELRCDRERRPFAPGRWRKVIRSDQNTPGLLGVQGQGIGQDNRPGLSIGIRKHGLGEPWDRLYDTREIEPLGGGETSSSYRCSVTDGLEGLVTGIG